MMDIVKAKKRLGQHFLTDIGIAQDITAAIAPHTARVLEIGPGTGVLTQFLLQLPDTEVHAIELDEESVAYLQQHFPTLRPRLYAKDFLKTDLATLLQPPFSIIGNFPYNISSQILFKILDYRDNIPEVVGMFQKEVAERIVSKPGRKNYGILSVLLQAYYDMEYLFTVHEQVFNPPPKVKSAVIRMKRNQCQKLDCDEKQWKLIVKTAFNQRRKTLRNSLKGMTFEEEFTQQPIFQQRPEQLGVEDFTYLCQHLITAEDK